MRTWGSTASVIAAVRDEAAAERERLERESEAALAASLSTAPAGVGGDAPPADRMVAARRAVADAAAADDWDDMVTAAADRDAWMAAIAERGRRAIADGPEAQSWLERVTREAVVELPGDVCIVAVPAALLAGAETWRVSVERDTGKHLTLEAAALGAGCIARTPDGRVTFDNTVDARERRADTEWRTAVARLYDQAVAAVPAGVA